MGGSDLPERCRYAVYASVDGVEDGVECRERGDDAGGGDVEHVPDVDVVGLDLDDEL